MADPFTPAFIAANCIWAMIQNRADSAAVTAVTRIAQRLRKQTTPANHDVLAATHLAFVRSIRLMAAAAEDSAGNTREHFSARELTKLVNDDALTAFDVGASSIPKAELDAGIRAIFEGADPEAGLNAADAAVARIETALGEPLPDGVRALFRHGSAKHRSWPEAFRLFFSEQVKTNERVFRTLAFDRLNEILDFAEANAGALAELNEALRQGFAESAERDARMENKIDLLLQEVRAQRGGQIEEAGIDPRAIVRIARKVSENVADAGQALAEIDAAIDDLLALRSDAARRSNLDSLVEAALQRIDERAAAGEFDAAAREAAAAFAEWESREADRRERERAVGLRFVEENIRANRLRRDVKAAAAWIRRRISLESHDEPTAAAATRSEIGTLIENGRDKGINLELEIAACLASFVQDAAQSADAAASALIWKGIALSTLGERLEGTEALDEAVAAYRAALDIYARDRVPLDWAMTQNNLGNALSRLGRRQEGTEVLDEAVAAYRAALEVYTRDRLPRDWATTQNNLGNALSKLGERQEGTEALDEAVAAYQAALEVYADDGLQLGWAMTQNNLGNALAVLGARQDGTEALDEAVAAYRAALEIYTRDRVPLDWAMTQNNLGNALSLLGARQEGTEALHEAVASYRAALEVYTRDSLPLEWATSQNNLGIALARLGERQEGTDALDEAVTAYRAALEVRTRDRLRLNWAMTKENLAYVLYAKAWRLGDCAMAGEAVAALETALEVFAHPSLARNRTKAIHGLAAACALRDQLASQR